MFWEMLQWEARRACSFPAEQLVTGLDLAQFHFLESQGPQRLGYKTFITMLLKVAKRLQTATLCN